MTRTVTNAETVVALLEARPPTLGDGRLLAVDGPAGSGKTTLAAEVAALTGASVVHLDDLYQGWDGLSDVTDQLDTLLGPLAVGRPGIYRRWDWASNAWAGTVSVPPAPMLVLEGVGSGSPAHAGLVTVLAWVEVPEALRLGRGLERDGPALAARWRQWSLDEQAHFATERTRERADVRLDGTRGSVAALE